MWRQIPWVANGLTLQGGLELLYAFVLLVGGSDSDAKPPETFHERLFLHLGPPLLFACGSLKAYAARRTRQFRNRTFGLVALWSALLSGVVLPCAPSGLALLIYGSLVCRHPTSRRAFALGADGRSMAEIATVLEAASRG